MGEGSYSSRPEDGQKCRACHQHMSSALFSTSCCFQRKLEIMTHSASLLCMGHHNVTSCCVSTIIWQKSSLVCLQQAGWRDFVVSWTGNMKQHFSVDGSWQYLSASSALSMDASARSSMVCPAAFCWATSGALLICKARQHMRH